MPQFVLPAPAGEPQPVNNRQDLLGFPRSYAFVIGINAYPHIEADLVTAVPDAERMAEVLETRQGFDHVELLTDATGADMRGLLQRLRDPELEPRIQPNDSLVFYYAGHGKAGEFDQGPAGFLLPSDTRPRLGALENDTLLPMEEVFDTLRALNCHHTLLILDCCFAGKFRYVGSKTRDALFTPFFLPLYEERFRRYKRERAWQVLASAGPDQTAADWLGERDSGEGGMHSPFAKALFQALEGAAEIKPRGRNLGDGVLTVQELFLYLWEEVEKKSREHSAFRIQYPNLFPMANHQGGQFIFFDPNNRLNFAERVERNPYRGLQSYEATDFDIFFGRKAVVDQLLDYLAHTRLLLVTAPSGLGKSSLVRAGLFGLLKNKPEELRRRGLKGLLGYEIREMRLRVQKSKPEAHPSPEAQFDFGTGPPQEAPAPPLTDQLIESLRSVDPSARLILYIDAYEELFTEWEDPKLRERFEMALWDCFSAARKGALRIVLSMRSDFEWRFQMSYLGNKLRSKTADEGNRSDFTVRWAPHAGSYPAFHHFRLPPMGLDELRETLVHPAWVESYDFESDELIDTILEEIGYAPGALPMLSFTMSEFYKLTDKDKRIFTFFDYRNQLGGVSGALGRKADEIYQNLPDDGYRETFRKILLRMFHFSFAGTYRRRVYQQELDYPNDTDDKMVKEVLDRMTGEEEADAGNSTARGGGLLIIRAADEEGSVYYEPAHDALINSWPTFLRWVEEFGHEHLVLQRRLWNAVLEWQALIVGQQIWNITSGFESPPLRDEDGNLIEPLKIEAPVPPPPSDALLWDDHPQLRQVLSLLLHPYQPAGEPESPQLLKAASWLWNSELDEGTPEDLRATLNRWETRSGKKMPAEMIPSDQAFPDKRALLKYLLAASDHWFNQLEVNFVLASWNKRHHRFESLKKQREESEQKTRAVLSENLTFKSIRERTVNQTIAFRLAEAALERQPDHPVAWGALLGAFYRHCCFWEGRLFSGLLYDRKLEIPFSNPPEMTQDQKVKIKAVLKQRQAAQLPDVAPIQAHLSPRENFVLLFHVTPDLVFAVEVWEVSRGEKLLTETVSKEERLDFGAHSFSADDRLLALPAGDTVRLIQFEFDPQQPTAERTVIRRTLGSFARVRKAHFLPGADEFNLCAHHFDNPKIAYWYLSAFPIPRLGDRSLDLTEVRCAPDGSTFLLRWEDDKVEFRDRAGRSTGKPADVTGFLPLFTSPPDPWPRGQKVDLPDGAYQAFIDPGSGQIALSGKRRAMFAGHNDPIRSIAVSPDESLILTSSARELKLWDWQGNEVFSNSALGGYSGFLPDGKAIFTKKIPDGEDPAGHIHLWTIDPGTLLDWAEAKSISRLSPEERMRFGVGRRV